MVITLSDRTYDRLVNLEVSHSNTNYPDICQAYNNKADLWDFYLDDEFEYAFEFIIHAMDHLIPDLDNGMNRTLQFNFDALWQEYPSL